MHLKILTPEREVFIGEVKSVTLPGTQGYLQILEHHAPLVGLVGKGRLRYLTQEDEEKHLNVRSGTVEVKDNRVTVLLPQIQEQAEENLKQG